MKVIKMNRDECYAERIHRLFLHMDSNVEKLEVPLKQQKQLDKDVKDISKPNKKHFLIISYATIALFSLMISLVSFMMNRPDMASVSLLGIMCPIIFSAFNCVAMTQLKSDKLKLLGWNMAGFLFKSVYMMFLTYLGIVVFKLPEIPYVSALCLTFIIFHHVEAFYGQRLFSQ